MPINYSDVIALASRLAGNTGSEADLRAAVGRFYYGTLMLVRDLFIDRPSRADAHNQAASEIGRHARSSTRQQYLELYDLRGKADYDPRETNWDRKALTAKRLHEHIVDELRKRSYLGS